MGILSNKQIDPHVKIVPFEKALQRPGLVSYDVWSHGCDLQVRSQFNIFTNVNHDAVDPKNIRLRSFVRNEEIAHVIFLCGGEVDPIRYADQWGQYPDQPGFNLPKVD